MSGIDDVAHRGNSVLTWQWGGHLFAHFSSLPPSPHSLISLQCSPSWRPTAEGEVHPTREQAGGVGGERAGGWAGGLRWRAHWWACGDRVDGRHRWRAGGMAAMGQGVRDERRKTL